MPPDYQRHTFGQTGEAMAVQLLEHNGYRILERNYAVPRLGEIDIVAQDGDTLVFVEVRTRTTRSGGTPEETIEGGKLGKVILAAEHYLIKNKLDVYWRVDIVAILLNPEGDLQSETLLRNVTMELM